MAANTATSPQSFLPLLCTLCKSLDLKASDAPQSSAATVLTANASRTHLEGVRILVGAAPSGHHSDLSLGLPSAVVRPM